MLELGQLGVCIIKKFTFLIMIFHDFVVILFFSVFYGFEITNCFPMDYLSHLLCF